ncbi:hypothetical protein PsYK624_139740 [Phanerochaete sordida]|uniref:Tyrosine-protein kinase ephrin type A/B receptor-like domain-containing protein n=1 Tax=Phanerochaete sordida TaxID=48140 RepID=A0A9P3LJU0_9APHY|nr:hypothetical protein PsYK624_139740 [Phanerochaete sordida]
MSRCHRIGCSSLAVIVGLHRQSWLARSSLSDPRSKLVTLQSAGASRPHCSGTGEGVIAALAERPSRGPRGSERVCIKSAQTTTIPQVSCPAGQYGSSGACHPCPPGTYQPNAGSTSCIATDPNFYAPAPGETMESPCPSGTCSPGLAAICTAC